MQHLKFAGTVQRYVLIRHGGQAWVFVQPRSKKEVETGGGGYFRNFWVGMWRWDPGTLNLYQS